MRTQEKMMLIFFCLFFSLYIAGAIYLGIKANKDEDAFRAENELNNEQIIQKSRFCIDNGLNAEIVWHGAVDGKWVKDIRCTPETGTTDLIQGKKSQAVIIN